MAGIHMSPFPGLLCMPHTGGPILANLVLWAKTPISGAVHNSPVDTWPDSSGNANDLVKGSANGMLYDTATTLNGFHAMYGDGGEARWYTIPMDMSAYTAATIYVVADMVNDPAGADSTAGFWTIGNPDFNTHHPYTDGVIYESAFTTVRKTVGDEAPDLATGHTYAVVSTANDYRVYLNGTDVFNTVTNTFSSVPSGTTNRIGQSSQGGSTRPLVGRLYEILIYSVAHDTTQIAANQAYLSGRFAI